ncbi:NAD(P)/FAD-dependent oxidoreductase [Paraburkholderia sp. J67]|uniref:NAD(P)/FAD-dependent oxidoreductase n=1 Tax=Paraburkholderia sp. J67 TaxID=2805435 RepID=UPI002ABE71EC|nr:FAD-dependent oxidoreductase [Paraburkholderia sp. J67]
MVIIGAGECGARAAFALRESGWDGRIVLIGNEPGVPYERPPLSKPTETGVCHRPVCDDARLSDAKIEYLCGVEVERLDRSAKRVRLSDGVEIEYDKLLLATGARARALTCAGGERALLFRTLNDAQRLYGAIGNARHVALIGAGLIGMELAATMRTAGIDVTVIEAAPRPLGRAVPATLADRLLARHLEEGVKFRFNAAVSTIEDDKVILTDGTTVPAEVVVAAIGVVPETALAEQAGLITDNGIVVNHRLATSDPDIYAAGDCARAPSRYAAGGSLRLESWRNAQDQGLHAAKSMLGHDMAFDAVPWFWSDQYDLGLQIAGIPDPALSNVVRRLTDDSEVLFQIGGDGRLLSASGLGRGHGVAKEIKLAEMLIARGASPSPASLQDPSVNLKSLLRATAS